MCTKEDVQTMLTRLELKIKADPRLLAEYTGINSNDETARLIVSCFKTIQTLAEKHCTGG